MKTPILFLIFNRPDTTSRVFAEIKKAMPNKLYIAADGPRKNSSEDVERCQLTRKIVSHIDWPCEIKRLYRDKNLGCKIAVSSAIDWFFNNVEEGIILEDDCLPTQSFFTFSETMLEEYRSKDKIMMISGTNFLGTWKSDVQSYHFSIYGGIWGWATWKRAWNHYDVEMKQWSDPKEKEKIKKFINNAKQYKQRETQFNRILKGFDTWDFQWSFARLRREGLSIVPSLNLIKNIGFNDQATHTIIDPDLPSKTYELYPPFVFRDKMIADRTFDKKVFYNVLAHSQPLYEKILCKLSKLIK